ncbi:MAG: aminoglycoside phosphotransferase family protein [Alphaproteobacteria bacterium]
MSNIQEITPHIAHKLIAEQFPEYAHLPVTEVEKQGHDNRTYRLGNKLLIRMPTSEEYALKVGIEQELLPKLALHLSLNIPVPVKRGEPSNYYPYPFSIYSWLKGVSINLLTLSEDELKQLAFDLAKFLKELQSITKVSGPAPGQHNFWRGDHLMVYNKETHEQIQKLSDIINANQALSIWEEACKTKWHKPPVWIHGDFAIGNILYKDGKLTSIIDFGGMALGDPACDLVIAWTFLKEKARDVFIHEIDLDNDTWLRAQGWALWKATFELCEIEDKNSLEARKQKKIIEDVLEA